MRVELIGHFQPCMTDIYLHIDARMADYIRTHPYVRVYRHAVRRTVNSPDLELKPVFSTAFSSVFHACAREKPSVDFQLSDPATKNPLQ